ncbi:mechanosensitive ion channel family protein [Aliikangiella sp. IMCC44653]
MLFTNYIYAALLILAGFIFAQLIAKRAVSLIESKYSFKNGVVIKRLLFYCILTLFGIMALRQLGFNLSVLLGAAGILSVAIGFASKTSMSNVISGMFLLGEGAFSVGDTIKIAATTGEVISVDWLSVKLRTPDNLYVRIPNETIIRSEMINMSRFKIRRFDLNLSIAYKEDLAKVKTLLLDLVNNDNQCLVDPEPMVVFESFADSGVTIRLAVWAKSEDFIKFKGQIAEKVKSALDQEGIEIPFPHMSLYAGANSSPISIKISDDNNSLKNEVNGKS